MAAEGEGRGRPQDVEDAFNGAATGWPRKVRLTRTVLSLADLQWGRDRMAAEGRGPGLPSARPAAFNGAATGWPRKVVVAGGRAARVPALQWGRDRMAAEGL